MNERRDILKLLGIGAVGLVSTEATATSTHEGVPNLAQRGMERQLALASSLENMARAVRDGSLAITSLDVHSALKADAQWMSHSVHLEVEVLKDHVS